MSEHEPIRILRLIARLNMGGPALHVSYLTRGLEARGYATTLGAGALGRGEGSMSFVAEELGVAVRHVQHFHRQVSPVLDPLSAQRVVQLIREVRLHILQMGRAGRERTVPRYRVERLVDDVGSVYQVLLAEKGLPLPLAVEQGTVGR
jgi:hypothetical protein